MPAGHEFNHDIYGNRITFDGPDQLKGVPWVAPAGWAASHKADPDWESDHAIISRLRENERLADGLLADRDREIVQLRAERAAWKCMYERLSAVDEDVGSHDYHGPMSKPGPDEPGRPVPIPDIIHERFHKSVGDVLSGKIIPEARRQMEEALKNAPKEKTTIPVAPASKDDPRRIGFVQPA